MQKQYNTTEKDAQILKYRMTIVNVSVTNNSFPMDNNSLMYIVKIQQLALVSIIAFILQ